MDRFDNRAGELFLYWELTDVLQRLNACSNQSLFLNRDIGALRCCVSFSAVRERESGTCIQTSPPSGTFLLALIPTPPGQHRAAGWAPSAIEQLPTNCIHANANLLIFPHPSPPCDFPRGAVVKNMPAHAGDMGSIPGLGRSPGGGNSNPLQYSCLENPMDREAWRDTVSGVAKSQIRLSNWDRHTHTHTGPHIHSLGLRLYSCPANRFIWAIFLDSTYTC